MDCKQFYSSVATIKVTNQAKLSFHKSYQSQYGCCAFAPVIRAAKLCIVKDPSEK